MDSRPFPKKPVTDLFTNDTSIDRRNYDRVVPMKVLALGLGRTGTACMLVYLHFQDTGSVSVSANECLLT
jgi:hypothetical protein